MEGFAGKTFPAIHAHDPRLPRFGGDGVRRARRRVRRRSCSSAGRSGPARPRRRGRDGPCSGRSEPRCGPCRRPGRSSSPPPRRGGRRSSASRCRTRTWCPARTGAGRSRRRRRCPRASRRGGTRCRPARCRARAGRGIARGSGARATRRRWQPRNGAGVGHGGLLPPRYRVRPPELGGRAHGIGHPGRRAPIGIGWPVVVSRAVWCSISALISPPSRTIVEEIQIQVMNPITAPSDP